ncbi:AraC family transcriptional regulator [Butyrivibrio proteoclasticus]|uniref:AraC family transcriptional regulator n=1 Tax=Butyrivibrio proteoclasticus TaxID=43305 RepID=UPI0009DF9AC4|nr:AraC family transcriptional regulator [Butyrivibrio proteoclasticus]
MSSNYQENVQFNAPSAINIAYNEILDFPAHWHNALEFTIALKSGCKYRVNGVLYELSKGDVLLVWPQQIHETVSAPLKGSVFVQFPSTIIENNLDLLSITRFMYGYHHISVKKEKELANFISDKIHELTDIYESSYPLSETKCKVCIYDILLKIGDKVIKEKREELNSKSNKGSIFKYVHAACNYIVENSTDDLTQAGVASQIGLSTYYFSKIFKSYMNMSFPQYLANIRVRNAIRLLSDENLSITECAFTSGFQSTTAFNKAFHDITGYSPREYRKLYR